MSPSDDQHILGIKQQTLSAERGRTTPDALKVKAGRLSNRARGFGINVADWCFIAGDFFKISANICPEKLVCEVRFLCSDC